MSKPFAGSFSYFRQPKSKARWKSPAIPEFEPSWLVVLYMPGMSSDRGMRRHLPLCEDCKASPGNPSKERPNCACIKAVERWAKEELTTRTVLLQKGKLKELQEMREPEKYATPAKVLMTYKERGPKDAKARYNSLRCIFEQATGKDIKDLRWSSQTNYLLRHSGAAERMTSGDSTKAAALLGHKTTAMAETTYGRVLDIQNPISDEEILRRIS
ncbi:MAG TPA: hypothetical protein VGE29_21875 [Prosthecobacter sp.]